MAKLVLNELGFTTKKGDSMTHFQRRLLDNRLSKAHGGININKCQLNKDGVQKPIFNATYNDGGFEHCLSTMLIATYLGRCFKIGKTRL